MLDISDDGILSPKQLNSWGSQVMVQEKVIGLTSLAPGSRQRDIIAGA